MKKKIISNLAASLKAKLLNISKRDNKDFNKILLRYFQERFLYRLSVSEYKNNFILKGGLLLILVNIPTSRVTVDIDFLAAKVKNDLENIKDIFSKISSIEVQDGIVFNSSEITAERIEKDSRYEGVRVKIQGHLGTVKQILQIDLGFGDVIFPKKSDIEFPSLLLESKSRLKGYPLETVIAEKFEAMVKLGMLSSRMKDFYDAYILLNSQNFNKSVLREAIKRTFNNRKTQLQEEPLIFTSEFYNDKSKQIQWEAFLRKNKLTDVPEDFKDIVLAIKEFLAAARA